MDGVLVSSLVSVLTGLALWAVLPRGVVLTRTPLTSDHKGDPLFNRWTVRNESALPIRLTKVSHSGVHTYEDATGRIQEQDLPPFIETDIGISLNFDDEVLVLTRDDGSRSWSEQVIPPGDTLTAYVDLNRTLRIRYRRAGLLGVFERREITIDGGV